MKLCKDCKYHGGGYYKGFFKKTYVPTSHYCTHSESLKEIRDVITGEHKVLKDYKHCLTMREDESKCGIEGKYYEPRDDNS